VPSILRENQRRLQDQGDWFQALRSAARQHLIEAAVRYTSAYRAVDWPIDPDAPIIMAGHQPALFHPGVWFKNFALSELAQSTGAVAVNLVVDNDVSSGSHLRVPTIDPDTGAAVYRTVAYDDAGGGIPFEQTTIRDLDQFDQFDQEVANTIRPLVRDPSVTELWKYARAAIARCGVAGCALAQARHGLEGSLGLKTLEVPLGVVCRSTSFAQFVLSILDELPRFQRCYNAAAKRYRLAHGIRSSAHPVPDLAVRDQWFEAPFWIYGDDSPARRPVWVCRRSDELILSDLSGRELRLDSRFPRLAAERLAAHASPNFKLRPRALLTTMYARLVLSDLFLHGIGGGKYDQLSDLISQEFFGFPPPRFMVISATIQLPGQHAGSNEQGPAAERRRLQRAIRDTHYQGERFAEQAAIDPLDVDLKRRFLAAIPPPGERQQWTREVQQVNARISNQLFDLRGDLQRELFAVQRTLTSDSILTSREHSFCLFPLDYLTSIYRSLLAATD
jgi:hypothetical protein